MSVTKYLETAPLLEIIKYKQKVEDYPKDSVPFTGTPRQHPYDSDKLLLMVDPFSEKNIFYEFKISDILHAEEMSNLGTESGKSLNRVKLWIRKGSFGLKYEPFKVGSDDTQLID